MQHTLPVSAVLSSKSRLSSPGVCFEAKSGKPFRPEKNWAWNIILYSERIAGLPLSQSYTFVSIPLVGEVDALDPSFQFFLEHYHILPWRKIRHGLYMWLIPTDVIFLAKRTSWDMSKAPPGVLSRAFKFGCTYESRVDVSCHELIATRQNADFSVYRQWRQIRSLIDHERWFPRWTSHNYKLYEIWS